MTMDRYVFVVLNHDYSDEFDVTGAAVFREDDWEEIYAKVERGFDKFLLNDREFYFGTNEALMFDSFQHFSSGVNADVCTKAFHDEFKTLAGNDGVIGFWVVDQLLERIREEDEEDV